jgi:hypothetical protein
MQDREPCGGCPDTIVQAATHRLRFGEPTARECDNAYLALRRLGVPDLQATAAVRRAAGYRLGVD